jgi:tetratricopeptide (TPR) repeat protein
MFRRLSIIILLFSALTVRGQPRMDSLKQVAHAMPKGPDKVKALGLVSWEYAITHTYLNEAWQYADSVRILGEELNDSSAIALANFYYGVIHRFKGNYYESLEHVNRFITYFASVGDSSRVAKGLFQIGVVNHDLGNFEKSLAAYYRIMPIREAQHDYYALGYTLNSIGVIYKNMKRYDEALKVYDRALILFDSLNEVLDLAGTVGNMGNVYSLMGQFDKAKEYYNRALQLNREIHSEDGEAYVLENMGNVLSLQGVYDSALFYHRQALALREKFSQIDQTAISLTQVGACYGKLHEYARARHYLDRALQLAQQIRSKTLLRDVYRERFVLFEAQRKYDEAFEAHKQYAAFKDSVLNEVSTRQVHELQAKYEASEKDKQIMALANEKQIQDQEVKRQSTLKKTFIAGSILMGIVAVLVAYTLRQRLKNQALLASKNVELKEATFRQQLSDLEMKALRSQINPHFLFNCMNSINRMILSGNNENASVYLTKLSKLVRMILENTESGRVSLENELALIESYIQMEELRFKGKIDYQIQVDQSLEKENTFLPSMVLQPFVENAIWHGLMHKERQEHGYIKIGIREKEDALFCTIEDNGVGRDRSRQLQETNRFKTKSMGMKITEERLRLLNREKLEELVRVVDLKDSFDTALGTRVEISIPLA